MAIPWLIGAAVVGVAGVVGAALSDDDSSSSSGSGERELEREREKAEAERKIKLAQAKLEQLERQITEQNRAHAKRFINKYGLNISADSLIASSKEGNLEVTAIQAYQSNNKFINQSQQIDKINKQLEEMQQLENELIKL
jgi:hypothetical protein